MDSQTAWFILGLAGTFISLLLLVVGFFLARVVSDVRSNKGDIGKNKGSIELVKLQQENDIKRIEESTQKEIRTMAMGIDKLTSNVNTLVIALAKRGIEPDEKHG